MSYKKLMQISSRQLTLVLKSMTNRWHDFRMKRSTAAALDDERVEPSSLSYL